MDKLRYKACVVLLSTVLGLHYWAGAAFAQGCSIDNVSPFPIDQPIKIIKTVTQVAMKGGTLLGKLIGIPTSLITGFLLDVTQLTIEDPTIVENINQGRVQLETIAKNPGVIGEGAMRIRQGDMTVQDLRELGLLDP